jgi:hypothetical protein
VSVTGAHCEKCELGTTLILNGNKISVKL